MERAYVTRSALRYLSLCVLLASLCGCGAKQPVQQPSPLETAVAEAPAVPPSEVTIGSWNIQVFGKTKAAKQEVMDVIGEYIRKTDIIAIQEIKNGSIAEGLTERVNAAGRHYAVLVGPAMGRSTNKEHYTFLYDTDKVSYTGQSYTYDDVNDVFEREPFIASFAAGAFSFVLVNIHTKPDNATLEIQALEDVVNDATVRLNEQDVIVIGDFNADGNYFSETITSGLRSPTYVWAIGDALDTTVAKSANTYDRIVFRKESTASDFSGKSGTFKFDENLAFGAKNVSDHYPIFAIFYTDRDTD